MSLVTYMKEAYQKYEGVMSRIHTLWIVHKIFYGTERTVTNVRIHPYVRYRRISQDVQDISTCVVHKIFYVWMSHVTYERVMSRMNETCHI